MGVFRTTPQPASRRPDFKLFLAPASGVSGVASIAADVFTVSASGTVTAPSVSGTVSVSPDIFSVAATGSSPGASGTVAVAPSIFTIAAVGASPGASGTAAIAPGVFSVVASGAASFASSSLPLRGHPPAHRVSPRSPRLYISSPLPA
jgi:hypothetical protein